MNELYVKLMILCDEKHITPYRMCQDIQLRQSAISDLKHGRKEYLSLSNMLKAAKYFDVSLEWLRGEEERTPFYKGNEKREEEIRPDAFSVSPDDFVDLAEVWNTYHSIAHKLHTNYLISFLVGTLERFLACMIRSAFVFFQYWFCLRSISPDAYAFSLFSMLLSNRR